jgi:8-oxo-dGTP diphosphatase
VKTFVVVKVFLENSNGEILILRRSHTAPRRALEWDLPGGWIEPGEDPLSAAIRELQEETSISTEDLREEFIAQDQQGEETITRHYMRGLAMSTEVMLSYEHDQYRWVSKSQFVDTMQYTPHVIAFGTIYRY